MFFSENQGQPIASNILQVGFSEETKHNLTDTTRHTATRQSNHKLNGDTSQYNNVTEVTRQSNNKVTEATRRSNHNVIEATRQSNNNVNEATRRSNHNVTESTRHSNHNVNKATPQSTYHATEATQQLQTQRLQHLQRVCADKVLFKNAIYMCEKKCKIKYLHSSKYNFTYCSVPKAGCSFWTQAFAILRYGANASDAVFGLKRRDLHHQLGVIDYVPFESDTRRNSRSILVSRHPYSRLFSAFIDKMFLPLMYNKAVSIVQEQRNLSTANILCANDITFEEFLAYIVDSANAGRSLNRHWAPIVSLCNPCDTNVLALVKQETFSTDVEYVLRKVGIADDEYNVIYDALHDHRIDATIPGIVATATTLTTINKSVQQCVDRIEVARRIWVSFQVQGYIKDDISFPTKTINTNEKAKNPDFLSKVIIETIEKHPMSPDETKLQRRRALVKAFDGLSKNILYKVKKLYKKDFILFDYSTEPPTMEH